MDLSKATCTECGKQSLRAARTFMFHARCTECGALIPYKALRRASPRSRPKRSRGQRRSKKQERRRSKEAGAKRHQRSGSDWRLKSDASDHYEGFRHEFKTTGRASITVRRDELEKIFAEAAEDAQVPVFQFDFTEGAQAVGQYAILRWADVLGLIREVRRARGEDE